MSNQTLSQTTFLPYYEWLAVRSIELLNDDERVLLGFMGSHIFSHEHVHDIINHEINHEQKEIAQQAKLESIPEEIKSTPVLVSHALNHAKQTNLYYRHECGFWEDLPEPTVQEAVKDVFGLRAVLPPARTSAERQADNFLHHRSFHERLVAEARAEEAATQTQNEFQLQAEPLQPETKLFPIFTGLKLKNSDRAEKDGYLLYVGSRADCVRAASSCQKGSVKVNSKDSSSWRYLLSLKDIASDSQQAFNFRLFASNAIQSYKGKNAA